MVQAPCRLIIGFKVLQRDVVPDDRLLTIDGEPVEYDLKWTGETEGRIALNLDVADAPTFLLGVKIRHAISPAELDMGQDKRALGLCVQYLRFQVPGRIRVLSEGPGPDEGLLEERRARPETMGRVIGQFTQKLEAVQETALADRERRASVEHRLALVEADRAEAVARAERVEALAAELMSSTSWRITGPLRRAIGLFRRR